MTMPRLALPFAVLTFTAFPLSCDSNGEWVSGVDGRSPTFTVDCTERPDHPRCGGDGGSGGSSGADSDLTLAVGYAAATASADIESDNKKWLKVTSEGLTGSSGLAVAINFDDTDISTCTGDTGLFGALIDVTGKAANFELQVAKESVDGGRDPRNWMRVRRAEDDVAEPRVDLNFSTGTDHPDALVTLDVGDINDASQPRVLRFSDGAVRVTQRIDVNTSTTLICDQAVGDDVVVTIAPPSPSP